jgi:hypothetical protein
MKKPAPEMSGFAATAKEERESLLLPSTLLVAISLQALTALVLRHLETALLLQITHKCLEKFKRPLCKPVLAL